MNNNQDYKKYELLSGYDKTLSFEDEKQAKRDLSIRTQ